MFHINLVKPWQREFGLNSNKVRGKEDPLIDPSLGSASLPENLTLHSKQRSSTCCRFSGTYSSVSLVTLVFLFPMQTGPIDLSNFCFQGPW